MGQQYIIRVAMKFKDFASTFEDLLSKFKGLPYQLKHTIKNFIILYFNSAMSLT